MAGVARKGDSITGYFDTGSQTPDHGGHQHAVYRQVWVPPTYDSDGNQTGGGYYKSVFDHYEPDHPSGTISGTITGGSSNVYVNGYQVARIGDTTNENDICDSNKTGRINEGSSKIFVNGKGVARNGDAVTPHTTGYASINSGSPNVLC